MSPLNLESPWSSLAVEVRSLVHDAVLELVQAAHVPFATSPPVASKL